MQTTEQGIQSPPEAPAVLVRAHTVQIVMAAILDVLLAVFILVMLAVVARTAQLSALGVTVACCGGLLAGVLGWAVLHRRFGAAFGDLLVRLRTIDPATGMPVAVPRPGMLTFDLRAGADPLRLTPDPAPLPTASEAYAVDSPAYITIEIDDGRRLAVRRHAIVGHRPNVRAETLSATPIVLTDFSRTVDRAHALISLVPQGIIIQSLTTRSSTWIDEGDGHRPLPAGESVQVTGPVDLFLGERQLWLARREAKAGSW